MLGKQLLRSATSVGANGREACRARSHAEFTAKVGDSLKELEETIYWLDSGKIRGPQNISIEPLLNETMQLTAIFTTIDKKVKARNP